MRLPRFCLLLAAAALVSGCNKPDDPVVGELEAPRNLVLHGSTETSLTFQWSQVEDATGYEWRLVNDTDGTRDGSTVNRNVTVDNLKPGTAYRFSVCATCSGVKSQYSSELEVVTQGTAPPVGGKRVKVDMPLVLDFDSAPVLGKSGTIRVFTAAGKEIDRIDLADMAGVRARADGCTVPVEQITDASRFSSCMDALPCSGKWRTVHYTPLLVEGKSLIIRLHSGVLAFDTEYYATIDAGVIEGHAGIAAGEWKFTTSAAPVSSSSLRVAADGSGDFCTIQRALDYASAGGCEISVAPGTYSGMLFARDKANITIKGDSREGVKIVYPNNESYEVGSGGSVSSRPAMGSTIGKSGGRSVFLVENCDKLVLQDLTLENSFGELKGQAETIYFNSGSNAHRLTVENCSLLSYQDTFLCKGEVWVHNSLIAGHCDFIWGYPRVCLFEDCEIRSRAAGYIIQARVPSASDKGFVFLNCRLTAESGVKDGTMYLARSAGQTDCFDNVVYVNCKMSPVIAAAGWYSNPAPNPATPTATSGWREFGSTDSAGNPATGGRNALGRVLTSDEAAGYMSRSAVLGW